MKAGYQLLLPRWDTEWVLKTRRGGWPVIDPRTRKPRRWRPVWDPLRGNARTGHYQQRAAATRAVIEAITQAATRAGITGHYEHVTVQLHWAPGDRRRADADNLAPLQKACADALARGRKDLPGLHLVPDDRPQWMTKLMPRIEPPPTPAGLWLTVEVDPAPTPARSTISTSAHSRRSDEQRDGDQKP